MDAHPVNFGCGVNREVRRQMPSAVIFRGIPVLCLIKWEHERPAGRTAPHSINRSRCASSWRACSRRSSAITRRSSRLLSATGNASMPAVIRATPVPASTSPPPQAARGRGQPRISNSSERAATTAARGAPARSRSAPDSLLGRFRFGVTPSLLPACPSTCGLDRAGRHKLWLSSRARSTGFQTRIRKLLQKVCKQRQEIPLYTVETLCTAAVPPILT